MSGRPGFVRQWWLKWKSAKLPWRREWLVGRDLSGNTFWEFKETPNATRLRRIVKYNYNVHYADVKLTPAWVQWLRHTRPEPPSIQEQQLDEIRQIQIKKLAAAADARWAGLPSFKEGPDKMEQLPTLESHTIMGELPHDESTQTITVESDNALQDTPDRLKARDIKKSQSKSRINEDNPWAASEREKEQQPDAWTPKLAKRG